VPSAGEQLLRKHVVPVLALEDVAGRQQSQGCQPGGMREQHGPPPMAGWTSGGGSGRFATSAAIAICDGIFALGRCANTTPGPQKPQHRCS
jgi:hypothetical protein